MVSDTCVVVGVGPGLGSAIAERFAREKFNVGVIARRRNVVEETASHLQRKHSVKARGVTADVGQPEQLRAALTEIAQSLGPPRVLVYNVSVLNQKLPTNLDFDALVNEFKVNVGGALVAVQHAVGAMKAAGDGTILITGGGLALEPFPEFASLAIGKAGVRSLALSLAKELEPRGIHVATVTVCGMIQPATYFDPARIADEFWKLHIQPKGSWQREVLYRELDSSQSIEM